MGSPVALLYAFVVVSFVPRITCDSVAENLHYIGCYDPGYSLRQNYHHHIIGITLAKCVDYCKALNIRFVGVEGSDNFCYCGGDIGEESVKRNDSLCNVQCRDDPSRTCGGDWLISLYSYDINPTTTAGSRFPGSDSDHMDFLLAISIGVRLYHSSDLTTFEILMITDDWALSTDYHFSKNLVFVYSKKRLYRATLDPKRSAVASTPILLQNISSCDGFVVDWVRDRVFWADCDSRNTAIKSMSLDGKAVTTMVTIPKLTGKMIKRMEVDPYKGMLFWTADGVVCSCEISGGNFQTNLSNPEMSVRALSLDLQERRVFFVGTWNQSTSLFSMDYDGGEVREHFSILQMRSVYGLSVLGGQVFWVNYANVRDIIYKAPVNLTHPDEVTVIKIADRAVWHMRVVHPELQKQPKRDPCQDKGCSYLCVNVNSYARCQCPEGQELHSDGISCYFTVQEIAKKSSGVPLYVYSSFLLITAVLLASLGLVYLGDRYWSLLESKLFGTSNSNNRVRVSVREGDLSTGTPDYQITEDNVNLI